MASKRVVLIYRDRLLASRRFRELGCRERGAFLVSLCLLARNDDSPRRGCLCAGDAPLTLSQWQTEIGESRRDRARSLLDRLIELGLFEWAEIDGHRYMRVARFADQHPPRRPPRQRADVPPTPMAQAPHRPSTNTAGVAPQGLTERPSIKTVNSVNVPVPRTGISNVSLEGSTRGIEPMSSPLQKVLGQLATTMGLPETAARNDDATAERNGVFHTPKDGNGTSNCANLVTRIERITGDTHSRRNWTRLAERMSRTSEGLDAILTAVCELEDAMARPDPGEPPLRKPGAVLNARLRDSCSRLGIAV